MNTGTVVDPLPVHDSGADPLPPGTIAINSDPRWRNPFDDALPGAASTVARAAALTHYAVWLAGRRELIDARGELEGHHLACSCPLGQPCHRDVLLDLADPDTITGRRHGRAVALTVRRPWASLLLVPGAIGGKNIENRSWSTEYRGALLIVAGTRVDQAGILAAQRAGLDTAWHTRQHGWLGAAVLTDVHPATPRCCPPWGQAPSGNQPLYHWVFDHPARLALPVHGTGFLGLRRAPWTKLIRAHALGLTGPNDGATATPSQTSSRPNLGGWRS